MKILSKKWVPFIFTLIIALSACSKDDSKTGNKEPEEEKPGSVLSIDFTNSESLVVMGVNSTRYIDYKITSDKKEITIEAQAQGGVQAQIIKKGNLSGSIKVRTGETIDASCAVVILVSNGSMSISKRLTFEEEAIKVEENTVKEVKNDGGNIVLEFFSNTKCHADIPIDARSWIEVVPNTQALTKQNIKLKIKANQGYSRSAVVNVVGDNSASSIVLSYIVNQEMSESWKDLGTIPPDDEIWYITSNNKTVDIFVNSKKPFNSNVISNSYDGDRGVGKIKCDAPITTISDCVFGSNDEKTFEGITSLFLPNTVHTIGSAALTGVKIQELRMPDNLTNVGMNAFGCHTIKKFLGKNVTEDGRCLIIQGTLCAFAGAGLSSYSIPPEVEYIGGNVFGGCKELKNIILNEGLKRIGDASFGGCELNCDIVLPSSLEHLHCYAFRACSGIKGFYGNEKFHTSDHLCLLDEQKIIIKFVGRNNTEYIIPEGITGIVNYAFEEATNLYSVAFPTSFASISPYAFYTMQHERLNIERISGDCVTADGRGIVLGTEFSRLLITNGVSKYVVPNGIKSIGYQAFLECTDLEEIVIPDSVTELGGYDFAGCINLKKIVLSSNLERINTYNPFFYIPNIEEIYFRSFIPPIYFDTQFRPEEYRKLKIYVPEETLSMYRNSPQWSQFKSYMRGYKYNDIGDFNPNYYISSDYSKDGTVETIQMSSVGNGINVILMGDAFSDRQIADGTYDNVMRKTAEALFSEEPYKSFKDNFNISYVNVVSQTEGYDYSNRRTLGTEFGGGSSVSGNKDKVVEYSKKVISENELDDALIIVIMNKDAYAGTCYMYDCIYDNYGRGLSIAYFPAYSDIDTFNGIVLHEAGGHGFAKLADEYAYEYMGAIPESEKALRNINTVYGWWKNVDFTNDPTQVKWSQFISDERYNAENIGCYEGGFTFWTGVWHPTENSIMRYNTGGFNAPSRYAIWYRIGKLANGSNWNGSYEDFVTYDAVNRTSTATARRQGQVRKAKAKKLPPLHAPVVVGHSWREAKK